APGPVPQPAGLPRSAPRLPAPSRRARHVPYRANRGQPHARRIYLVWNGAAKHHRSGWAYALRSLLPLHSTGGVLFDGFIEKKFAWGGYQGDRDNVPAPYLEPWIGVVHNPPPVPDRLNVNEQAPWAILPSRLWQE